ncbi:unnamed protein product [Miscanthus lutarioriparius]|uniref:Uncharacterized protein n=1 Tax=Miscanthus lutarioriparius TaxID=422564 RepID=A0A811PDB6_9POAL|nr:unnamed protein product [Miscanthus lutarioriparius]
MEQTATLASSRRSARLVVVVARPPRRQGPVVMYWPAPCTLQEEKRRVAEAQSRRAAEPQGKRGVVRMDCGRRLFPTSGSLLAEILWPS